MPSRHEGRSFQVCWPSSNGATRVRASKIGRGMGAYVALGQYFRQDWTLNKALAFATQMSMWPLCSAVDSEAEEKN